MILATVYDIQTLSSPSKQQLSDFLSFVFGVFDTIEPELFALVWTDFYTSLPLAYQSDTS